MNPADKPPLPRDLWDFTSPGTERPPDDPLSAWVHYEYARTYWPMVAEVRQLRKHPRRLPEFAFAKTLARHFPEFPEQPWVRISVGERVRRLAELDALVVPDPSPTPKRPVRLMDLREFSEEVLPDTVLSEDSPAARRFWVVEVCYQAEDEVIAGEFGRQFSEARQQLIRDFDRWDRLRSIRLKVIRVREGEKMPDRGTGLVIIGQHRKGSLGIRVSSLVPLPLPPAVRRRATRRWRVASALTAKNWN